jgi:3-hydroxyisobutyrate dehydrogenase-like beta-hydroxyacid dehydrogenase
MPKKSRKNVGLIGLGIIGSRVADALRTGGFHVYVWNRTPRAAPNFLPSPRQVAELCDVIQIFVADAQALFDVLDAMGDALTSSHIVVCNSTVGPEATLDAARLVQDRGAQFLDAPFTGSKAQAQSRELVYFIGGDDKTLQAVEPVLQASSKAIVKIGKIGDAAVIKVATNMLVAVTVQTLAEAYAITKESGINPAVLADALKHHAVRSGTSDAKLAKMLDRDYEPHFSLKHMFKDVQLGIHIANSLDIDLPATTATAGVMYGGLTKGWANEDLAVLARTYQKDNQPPPTAPVQVGPPTTPAQVAPASGTDGKTPSGTPPPPAGPPPAGPAQTRDAKEASRESTPAELRDAGIKVPDGKFAPHVQAAPDPAAVPAPTAAPAAGPKPESPIDGNGDPARQHPPLVRLRRWFGTGSPN